MQDPNDILIFFGRFHPLIVHLPIGILLFALLIFGYSIFRKNEQLLSILPFTLFIGFISALSSCILGYLLSLGGGYNEETLDIHLWMGITTTVLSFIAWVLNIKFIEKIPLKKNLINGGLLLIIVGVISGTGHYGGFLTHGKDYLTAYSPFHQKEVVKIESLEEAIFFDHVIQPILEEKCSTCHNDSKQKGELSLKDQMAFENGGKSGNLLVAGHANQSELFIRVTLNSNDEKFMPTEGKTPLTNEEIALIKFWIEETDANYDISVGDYLASNNENNKLTKPLQEKIKDLLGLGTSNLEKSGTLATLKNIEPKTISKLEDNGFIVRELLAGSNQLSVSIPPGSMSKLTDQERLKKLSLLELIKSNIVTLSLKSNNLKDTDLSILNGFEQLQKLSLDRNQITDKGIEQLPILPQLEILNLHSTLITNHSLNKLKDYPNLKKLYSWNTKVEKTEQQFPYVIN